MAISGTLPFLGIMGSSPREVASCRASLSASEGRRVWVGRSVLEADHELISSISFAVPVSGVRLDNGPLSAVQLLDSTRLAAGPAFFVLEFQARRRSQAESFSSTSPIPPASEIATALQTRSSG
ncbi:hypothetical protein A1Q1_06563 [Trichosporon asahii var. asahii CBS 2479]|uniref:Uncharacterized protein n=1 Tax=Trichosporon asahii var. asahii (strain ATCC 90039 / CBS 2479 / JCM 2466 / KCTC 7840 / NBRC 103889/ NCYC 2677 / UAMH 7654) TaxID=1186058 RepID=J5SD81_TRIAS|nr:hypothetical protein A1Q1_06563 [Trichosporon asahii var. asahii CBS 2479]EJT45071.1 hypothetical protein A1Q1_06563 [Trichosporon asahii var. asahii CBS 2479]